MDMHIALVPGDGIGPEIVREAVRVLDRTATVYRSEKRLWRSVFPPMPFFSVLSEVRSGMVFLVIRDLRKHFLV